MNIFKRASALLVSFAIALPLFAAPAFSASDYTIEDAYYECKNENREFVESITSQGITDEQFIYFIKTIFDYMASLGDAVTRENYRDYIPDAIEYAFGKKTNIPIRDTLTSTYPQAVTDATNGIVPDEFRPLYETLKRIILEHDLLNLAPRIDSANAEKDGNSSEYARSSECRKRRKRRENLREVQKYHRRKDFRGGI